MSALIAGVMGPGKTATEEEVRSAYELGKRIAQLGWILLTGGRKYGVMDAAGRGAKASGGTVVGILPGADTREMSDSVDIPIATGMLDARNSINVLSSRILFFIGMNPGTASELALALKYGRPAILISQKEDIIRAFQSMSPKKIEIAADVSSSIEIARRIAGSLDSGSNR
ncbi:MAG: cytochrome [Acidobacteria bacterium]|nr:cytochrome [Acidobacteriota bacterium]